MNVAERLRVMSNRFYATDDKTAAELAILSSEAQGLMSEIGRLEGELSAQAETAVSQMAKMITDIARLREVLLPFAHAHKSSAPHHAVTLDHLRKAYDVLNRGG